jgi:hypothetical protein
VEDDTTLVRKKQKYINIKSRVAFCFGLDVFTRRKITSRRQMGHATFSCCETGTRIPADSIISL